MWEPLKLDCENLTKLEFLQGIFSLRVKMNKYEKKKESVMSRISIFIFSVIFFKHGLTLDSTLIIVFVK